METVIRTLTFRKWVWLDCLQEWMDKRWDEILSAVPSYCVLVLGLSENLRGHIGSTGGGWWGRLSQAEPQQQCTHEGPEHATEALTPLTRHAFTKPHVCCWGAMAKTRLDKEVQRKWSPRGTKSVLMRLEMGKTECNDTLAWRRRITLLWRRNPQSDSEAERILPNFFQNVAETQFWHFTIRKHKY